MAAESSLPPIRRKASYRALQTSLLPPQRSGGGHNFSCEPPWEDERGHFLDACFLCRAPLRASRDIYMYRGDTPFCSEECRQEQMELDEAREREASAHRRRWQHSAAPSSVEQGATPASGQRLRGPAADAIFAS